MKMKKEEFRKIFDEAMDCRMASSSQVVGSNVYTEDFEIEPKCVIRDFDIDTTEMQQTGIWDSSKVDEEFDDFEAAWDYLEGLRIFRIMTGSGIILYDNYSKEN